MHNIVKITENHTMICKHCGKPAKMFWFDKEMNNGRSETFWCDMHKECCEKVTGNKCKTLQELDDERKT